MATQLDLQEQEQLDELKAFWKRYGNLITWVLVLALGGFAAWNGWNYWQRDQGTKAAAMFDALEGAARAGDAARTGQVFADLKNKYPRTAYAGQGGLLAAQAQFDKGQVDEAAATLGWVADNASEDEHRTVARLRLAGILLDKKQYDEALRQVDAAKAPGFEALAADRRGDVLMAQGKKDEAKTAYQAAWAAMDARLEYRQLIEAKLTALGAAPAAQGAK
ncbi:YfgM family protein [Aquincola tertiaricarbonis]|uniref:YfgM family protein n=1 Tax=Aquincola tertiaricarbonis TaxID=391953 RepID=UPI0006152E60|nr:tetratricopeptide repeat protein [Aquincola tertiaricarbonis]